jgi:integrase
VCGRESHNTALAPAPAERSGGDGRMPSCGWTVWLIVLSGESHPKAIWHVVKAAAKRADIENLAAHDLPRTCARLCHLAGGKFEQIHPLTPDSRDR